MIPFQRWSPIAIILFALTLSVNVLAAIQLGPLSYDDLTSTVQQLCAAHPTLCRLTIAQDEFNLPSPGLCGRSRDKPCQTQILHITNFATYENDKVTRPQVYFSGEIHGDERVGPHAVVETARILLESSKSNPWIQRLVNTRSIWMTPITNSLGFDRNTREENAVDPNRDYPIDQAATACMNAIASRIANELYRSHMFQLAITFHGGMEAIAMEWGTTSRLNPKMHKSPDDFALLQMGGGLANFAGAVNPAGKNYPVGRMNDLVYPVPGGMEDWAYAGNWDPGSKRVPCTSQAFGGYPVAKTQYTDDMLRTVNILVETSDRKWPSAFGTPNDILNAHSGTGHVPRNVRLTLMVIDLVEPYIEFTGISVKGNKVAIMWEVGGAFEVDETYATIRGGSPTGPIIKQSSKLAGKTRWATNTYADRAKWPFRSRFSTCFRITPDDNVVEPADHAYFIEVTAKVDSAWAMKGANDTVNPKGYPPQSHVVNARTNPAWDKTNAGFRIKGKLDWHSEPRRVVIVPPRRFLRAQSLDSQSKRRDASSDDDDEDSGVITTKECTDDDLSSSSAEVKEADEDSSTGGISFSFVFSILAFLLFAAVALYMRRTQGSATHQRLESADDAET